MEPPSTRRPEARPEVLLLGAHRWTRQDSVDLLADAGVGLHALPEHLAQLPARERARVAAFGPGSPAPIFALPLDDHVTGELSAWPAAVVDPPFPLAAAETCLRKHRMRALWNDWATAHPFVAVPVWHQLIALPTFEDVPDGCLPEPPPDRKGVVVKPDGLDSSIAVHEATTRDELATAVRSTLATLAWAREHATASHVAIAPEVLVEERVPRALFGRVSEFSVETLTVGGRTTVLGVTDKVVDRFTHVELGHTFPTQVLNPTVEAAMAGVVVDLAAVLELRHCLAHWEFIVRPDHRIALVECNLRPAGDHITDLVGRVLGTHPYVLLVHAAHRGALPPLGRDGVAEVHFLAPLSPGRFVAVDAPEPGPDARLVVEGDLHASEWHGPWAWYTRPLRLLVHAPTRWGCRAVVDDFLARTHLRTAGGERVGLYSTVVSSARAHAE